MTSLPPARGVAAGGDNPAGDKPTPVRAAPAAPPTKSPVDVQFHAEGVLRTARALGAARASGTRAPLILVGFWDGEAEGPHTREGWVVGPSLEAIRIDRLEAAFAAAVAVPRRPGSGSG